MSATERPRVELVGGPLDGRRIPMRARGAFMWIDVRKGNLAYARRGKHRVLYRRVTTGKYLYAGHTHALCGGCGGWHERMDGHVSSCSLCGGTLISS